MMTTAYLDDLYRAPGPTLVARLNEGFPAAVFPALASRLALSTKALAHALGISDRTLRNRTRKLTGDEAERSFRAYRVFRRATEVLGSETAATAWLGTPQLALGEKRPLELLVRDVGANEVLDVLSGIEDGGYL
jgi:putative toxin-antitoxin system antitoxin component (TIGR02293 family)